VKVTTAAGDSFAAAFIYGYLNGWSMGDLAAFANAMGAAKVRKVGSGTQVPTAADVREVLKTYQAGIVF
jgi:sugar/nucleoside kinase (ribokinase family)